jgi:4-amino-4-deoxy-L-arabinose transferase-like glycosyltransferase
MKTRLEKARKWRSVSPSRRWKVIALVAILLVGFAVRIYAFPTYPEGLNQDEQSAAYEAYSLLTTGKDRWGDPFPAYFLGWGSGQNVLQSYLSIPSVAVFGLSPLGVRLVPLLLGVATLPLLFWVMRRLTGTYTALIATLILAVCPWHILLSRWGLESNLLPFFLLLGVATTVYATTIPQRRLWMILLSLIPFALAFYAYGTAMVIVPIIVLGLLVMYRKQVLARWRWWLGALGIAALISLPFLLFVIKNYLLHQPLGFEQLLPFSIPLLEESRIDQIRGEATAPGLIAPGDPIFNLNFFLQGFNDRSVYNVVGQFLPLPLGVLILAGIGVGVTLYTALKSKGKIISPFLMWLGASIGPFFIAALNVNQANSIFIPLIALAAIATVEIVKAMPYHRLRELWSVGVVTYVIISGALVYSVYLGPANAQALSTNYHPALKEAFARLETMSPSTAPIYVSEAVPLNYVQALFYTKQEPATFQSFDGSPSQPDFGRYIFSQERIPGNERYFYLIAQHEQPSCSGRAVNTWQSGNWHIGTCTP